MTNQSVANDNLRLRIAVKCPWWAKSAMLAIALLMIAGVPERWVEPAVNAIVRRCVTVMPA